VPGRRAAGRDPGGPPPVPWPRVNYR
jgi:hypothetical protein